MKRLLIAPLASIAVALTAVSAQAASPLPGQPTTVQFVAHRPAVCTFNFTTKQAFCPWWRHQNRFGQPFLQRR